MTPDDEIVLRRPWYERLVDLDDPEVQRMLDHYDTDDLWYVGTDDPMREVLDDHRQGGRRWFREICPVCVRDRSREGLP